MRALATAPHKVVAWFHVPLIWEKSSPGWWLMKIVRLVSLLLALALVAAAAPPGAADSEHRGKASEHRGKAKWVRVHPRGQAFCPSNTLVSPGGVVIERGRCFVASVIRERRGTFLAFFQPSVVVPPGNAIVLSSPLGVRLREQVVFLVPIATTAALVPVNTIVFVPIQEEFFGAQESLLLVAPASPSVTVIFNVRL